jgi:hypothetical protein
MDLIPTQYMQCCGIASSLGFFLQSNNMAQ